MGSPRSLRGQPHHHLTIVFVVVIDFAEINGFIMERLQIDPDSRMATWMLTWSRLPSRLGKCVLTLFCTTIISKIGPQNWLLMILYVSLAIEIPHIIGIWLSTVALTNTKPIRRWDSERDGTTSYTYYKIQKRRNQTVKQSL